MLSSQLPQLVSPLALLADGGQKQQFPLERVMLSNCPLVRVHL